MKFTIITSCFNRQGSIRAAIESVLCQAYKDIEYIIVDGGSTDGSREIIEKYRDRVAKIIFEPDRGMYEGINKGIRAATGDVIALCHSDDRLYDENTVARIAQEFEQTGADMVYADGVYLRRRNMDADEPARIWESGACNNQKLHLGWLPLHTTCYIKKKVYEEFGLYDESLKIAADTKFLLNILYNQKVKSVYLPRMVVKMRMGGYSTDIRHFQNMWNEDVQIYKDLGFRLPVANKMAKMAWKIPQYMKAILWKKKYQKRIDNE